MSESVEKFSFDLTFQKKILHLLINDVNFLMKSAKYLKKEYFDGNILPWIYTTIVNYYREYDKPITSSVFVTEIKKLPSEENMLEYISLVKEVMNIDVEEKEYIIDAVQEFIQRNIFVRGYKKVQDIFNDGRFDESLKEMKSCLDVVSKVSFKDTHRHWFFEELDRRIIERNVNLTTDLKFPTGIFKLDTCLGDGLSRGDLAIVGGDSGKGKSIFLLHVGASIVKANHGKVLHFSLEGRTGQVENRYEARLLNEKYNDITQNVFHCDPTAMYKRHKESLVIVEMIDKWDYTIDDLENEIYELRSRKFIPDVIIVDYGDLLMPRTVGKKDNTYLGQGEVFKDLKTLASKHNCVLWTATQFNRLAKGEDDKDPTFTWTRKKIADSYAKLRPADLFLTLNMTDNEQKNRQMRLYLDKYRDRECGIHLRLGTAYDKMFFFSPSEMDWVEENKRLQNVEND